jgi:hypothetical protein
MTRRAKLWSSVVFFVATLAIVALTGTCVAQPFVRPTPSAPGADVSPERLRAHVHALSVDLHPRVHSRPEQLDAAAAYIERTLAPLGKVEHQTFVASGRTYRNVILSLGPLEGERVVVGAHYDAALGLPGADDNASGVAGLLELAPLLAVEKLGARVDLVFWTLEEPPFFATDDMGSVHHARSLSSVRVRAAISLEMIGYFDDADGSQQFPVPGMSLLYGTRADFIAVVGRPAERALTARGQAAMLGATDLPVRSLNGPAAVQGVDWSDHRSYWAAGIPAIMITDTSFLRNDRYHTPRDTEDTLDYARMAKVVRGARAAVIALAQ